MNTHINNQPQAREHVETEAERAAREADLEARQKSGVLLTAEEMEDIAVRMNMPKPR
jgi:hypothetical protein